MKSDSQIREDVIRELRWDPQVSQPDAIGVAVTDGTVILTGRVPSYPKEMATARAAERVYGVKAVAIERTVKLSGPPRDDSEIAQAIARIWTGTSRSRPTGSRPRCSAVGSPGRAGGL